MSKKIWLIILGVTLVFVTVTAGIFILADTQTKINYMGWVFTVLLITSVGYSIVRPVLKVKKIVDIARKGKKPSH